MQRKIKIILLIIHFFSLISVTQSHAGSISPELQSLLSTQRGNGNIDVIIEFEDTNPLRLNGNGITKKKRKDIITFLKNKNKNLAIKSKIKSTLKKNRIKYKELWIKNSIATSIPANLISDLTDHDSVSIVRLDRKILLNSTDPGGTPAQIDWNISVIGADNIWNKGIIGENVIIGSMDSGVDINHPDLSTSWRGGINSWFDPYGTYPSPHDTNGHGTQTTSIIVGGSASGHAIGVAPGAKWIAAKIFDDSNTASLSAIHQSFQWMLDPDNDVNTDDSADIINSSWNFGNVAGQCDYEFQNDISILRAVDIAVVFSAGNSGPSLDTSHSPANNSDTIPVGAIDESLNVIFSSSRGPSACNIGDIYPKLTAPGINIYTADLTFGGVIPNSYTYSAGTSFSAPHVSGALALLQSMYPSSSLSEREEALYTTALNIGSVNDFGHGIVDIFAAFLYMGTAQLVAPSGDIGAVTNPEFTWNTVADATDYRLWLRNDSTGVVVFDTLYPTATVCSGAPCALTSPVALVDGDYRWFVRAKNGAVWGPNSSTMMFSVGTPPAPPVAATLIAPLGDIGAVTNPEFSWNTVADATDYRLWLRNDSTGVVVFDTLYPAATVCSGAPCALTSPVALVDGDYRWFVRAKNGAVWGPNSSVMMFTVTGVP